MFSDEDSESILTTISIESCSNVSHFCLDFLDDDPPELKDPFLFELKDELESFEDTISPEEEKLEHYLTECRRFELVPVGCVKKALLGDDVLDLKVYFS